ncbi:MAG: GldG family protein [Candidatus Omnitrophica bacterium]|nr:GldG family protein [Candidatus Omnitrophota bacterium]
MTFRFRNLFSGFQFITILISAFLIVLFSYLIFRLYRYRFDLSEGKVYSLADQTIKILKAFQPEPIHVYGFFREDQPAKRTLEDLLKEYGYRYGEFHYEFYDPDRMPAKAKQYQVDAYETIVIEAKGRREKTTQISEEAITNLLSRLLRQEMKQVVFAQGYGGPALDEKEKKTGYGLLKEKLLNSNYEVKETFIPRDKISRGTDLLVLGGPRVDLLPEELNLIQKYFDRGGNILILMDPVNPGEGKNLGTFLLEYGIELGDNVIVDKLSKLFGGDNLIPLVSDYKAHAITRGFRLTSFFSIARSVRKTTKIPAGFEVTEIAWTGPGSWAETDLKNLGEGVADFDPKRDQKGPLPVAVALQGSGGKGRLVVFGDSDFVANSYLNLSGNSDLILNTIAWLTGDEFAISIRPRMRETTPLYLKEVDQRFLFVVPVLGFPMLSIMMGSCIFFWRRRFH